MKALYKVSLLASPYSQLHIQQTYVVHVIQHLFCSHADLLRNNRQRCILAEFVTVSKGEHIGGISNFTQY